MEDKILTNGNTFNLLKMLVKEMIIKRLQVLHYNVVYIFLSFIISDPISQTLCNCMRETYDAQLAENS